MSLTKAVKGERKEPLGKPLSPTSCLAHGCPLPGVYRLSNETSICRVHDEQPSSSWGTITNRIRNREASFLMALDLTNASSGSLPPKAIERELVERHGAEFAVKLGESFVHGAETSRTYGFRVFGLLMAECRSNTGPVDPAPKSADTWRKTTELIERIAP